MNTRRPDDRPEQEPEAAPPGINETNAARSRGPVFSLENRPVPGLYLVAWVLCLGGVALAALGFFAASRVVTPILVIAGLVVLCTGLAAAAGYQVVTRRARAGRAYRGPSPLILFAIVVGLAQIFVGPLVLAGVVGETTTGVFFGALVIAGGYVAVVTLFVVRSGAFSWRDMGWPGRGEWSATKLIEDIAVPVAIMPAAILGVGIAGNVVAAAAGVQLESPLPQPRGGFDSIALVLTAVVVAPFGEELFFRGFSLTAWQLDLGRRAALLRSSAFFAAAHLINLSSSSASQGAVLAVITFIVYLPLGLLLGWLFQRRGIVAAICGHAAANGSVLLLNALVQPAAVP